MKLKVGTGEGGDCSVFISGRGKGWLDFNSKGDIAPGRSGEVIHSLSFTYYFLKAKVLVNLLISGSDTCTNTNK